MSISLPFRKIAHQMMRDLNCLLTTYSRIIEDSQEFENPVGKGAASRNALGRRLISDLCF
jgi:hypothetical protein